MNHKVVAAVLLSGLAVLAGCGSEKSAKENPFSLAFNSAKAGVKGKRGATAAPGLTRAVVDQIQVPLINVKLEKSGVTGAMVPAGVNGADVTWASADLVSVVTRGAAIRATRGMGEDLMSARVPSESSLRQDGAITQRAYYHLDGNDQTHRSKFTCDITLQGSESIVMVELKYQANRYAETCRGNGETFTNTYWFSKSGKILQSRQWISQSVGFLKLQHLKP